MKIQERYFGNKYAMLSEYHDGKHDYPEHIHHFLEVICVLEGEIEIVVNGITEVAHKGDIAVVPPFQPHSQHTQNYCKIWVGLISPVWVSEFFFGETFYQAEKNVFTPSTETFAYITQKFPPEKWVSRTSSVSRKLFRNVKALYYAILDEYLSNVRITALDANTGAISATYMYVYDHYQENITLKKVAEAIGYTSNYISSCLSVIPNANFRTILNSARVEHAKKLLISTNMKIVDIALDSGFYSENVFYGIFEKHTGMTPRKYRLLKNDA